MDLNEVTLIGRLGADPEMKAFNNGDKIANLRVATSKRWRDRQSGDTNERTEWHRVTVFGQLATSVCERYLNKGDRVCVRGELVTRKWQDQSGADRYSTEIRVAGFDGKIIMLGGRASRDHDQPPAGNGGYQGADLDDDIPF